MQADRRATDRIGARVFAGIAPPLRKSARSSCFIRRDLPAHGGRECAFGRIDAQARTIGQEPNIESSELSKKLGGVYNSISSRSALCAASAELPHRFDAPAQRFDRRRLHEGPQIQIDPERFANARRGLRREQRMAAEIEKIIPPADALDAEDLRKNRLSFCSMSPDGASKAASRSPMNGSCADKLT